MGVHTLLSTDPECLTPICSSCGISSCADITLDDYLEAKAFWDAWRCPDCNPNFRFALTRFLVEQERNK